MVQFDLLPSPQATTGTVQAFGPGDGELFEAVLSWGYCNLCDNEFETKEKGKLHLG